MHFLFLAAQFEFMTRFPTMILYFRVCTFFTAGPNIKWDVLHALQFWTGRYSYGPKLIYRNFSRRARRRAPAFAKCSIIMYYEPIALGDWFDLD